MIIRNLSGAAAALAIAVPAMAQDAYVIGVSGALTGPAAGTTAAPVEAFASTSTAQRCRRHQRQAGSS